MTSKKDKLAELTVLLNALTEHGLHQTEKGYRADCPVCSEEGKGKGDKKLFVSNDGVLSCVRYAGHDEEMRKKHRKEILESLSIGSVENFKNFDMGDGYTLRVEKISHRLRNQVILVHRPEGEEEEVVAVDTLKLDREADRARFIKGLLASEHTDSVIRQNVAKALVNLAGQAAADAVDTSDGNEIVYTGFFVLADGRVAEMTRAGFAVYDPTTGETDLQQVVEFDSKTYLMPRDKIFYLDFDEGIQLPPNIFEYGDTQKLMQTIEDYLHTYVDLPDFDRKLAAAYAMFTYLADKTYELPYYRIVGATGTMSRGSGKSRMANVLGRICYRPFKVTDPSSASTFRIMNMFHPTLVIDEFNFASGSDDSAQLIKILNTGFQRGQSITRMEQDELTKQMVVGAFSPFGAKIIGGLSASDSNAFESRCIRTEMKKTTRNNIEFRTSQQQLNTAARIRGMLTLWRLRNFHNDLETELGKAEYELKQYAIEPRYIQIATPIYAILGDENLRKDLAMMLVERTEDDAQERKLSTEGYLAIVIHQMIFKNEHNKLMWVDEKMCLEDEPCELLLVQDITQKYNAFMEEERPMTGVAIGKKLSKMMLKTHTIDRRNSPKWKKAAVIFSRKNLFYLFKENALEIPEDFIVPTHLERAERIVGGKTASTPKVAAEALKTPGNGKSEKAVADAWRDMLDESKPAREYPQPPRKNKNGGVSSSGQSPVKPLVNKSNGISKLKTLTRDKKTSGQPLVSRNSEKKALSVKSLLTRDKTRKPLVTKKKGK